jgi:hypothetical protein
LKYDIFNTSEYLFFAKKKLFIPRVVEELTPFVRAPYTDAHRESKQKAELTYIYS